MKDIVVRSISGVGFVGLIVASLLLNKFLFAAFMLLIMSGMMHEFYRMTLGHSFHYSRILTILAADIMFILVFLSCAYTNIDKNIVGFSIVPLIVVMVNSLYTKDTDDFRKFSHIYAGLAYIGAPLALSNLVVFDADANFDGRLMLCFFIIIWASDVGAYLFGCSLGQKYGKKLFPSISPKKSWIGFWGGMLTAVAAAVAMHFIGGMMNNIPLVHCLILGAIMHVAGVYGDLFESKWKRCCEVKDSGNIIPGHGGLLDRFDSAIMAVPAGVLYLMLAA